MSKKNLILWIILTLSLLLSSCIAPQNPLEGIDIPEPENPELSYYFFRGARPILTKQTEKLAQARIDMEQVIDLDIQISYPEAYPLLVECYSQLGITDSSDWIYPEALKKLEATPLIAKQRTEIITDWQSSYPEFPETFLEKDYTLLDTMPVPVGGLQRFYNILEYPEMAKNMNRSGITWLCFMIEADASLTNLHVLKSSYPDLDQAALDAIQQTNWIPARYHERPVPFQVILPVFFR